MSAKSPGIVQGYHILAYSLMWKRNCGTSSHRTFSVRKRNFKSQNILDVEYPSGSLCNGSKDMGAQGRRPLGQGHLFAIIYWRWHILGFWFLFSPLLSSSNAISCVMTRIQTLDKHHANRPLELSYLQSQHAEPKASFQPCNWVLG